MDNKKVANVFKALSDEKRISVIQYLLSGEKCACEISEKLEMSQSKLSYHMKILCESGLIESWYVGKWTHYKISQSGSQHAVNLLENLTGISLENTIAK